VLFFFQHCWLFRAEPILDDTKTVLEIVQGAAETMAVLAEYNSINDLFGLERTILIQIKWTS
jgi:hypothetical protein